MPRNALSRRLTALSRRQRPSIRSQRSRAAASSGPPSSGGQTQALTHSKTLSERQCGPRHRRGAQTAPVRQKAARRPALASGVLTGKVWNQGLLVSGLDLRGKGDEVIVEGVRIFFVQILAAVIAVG